MSDGAALSEFSPTVRTLENGITVAFEHLPYLHSAAVGVWINTGSANEREEEAGISHFLEHLLFKGTESRSARQLMDAIECTGGSMNAFTSRENTCLYVRMLDKHVAKGVEILADIIKHSTFCDLEKERNVVLEEIASSIDVPEEYAHDLLTRRVWPHHAMGRPIAGYAESVSAIGLGHVRAYKEAWYRPGNMYICAAGRFDEEELFRQIEDEFGSIPPGTKGEGAGRSDFGAGVDTVERDIAQNHLVFAFPGPAITDDRRHTYDLLSCVLGGGATSRLFDRIREEAGLAYSIYAFHSGYAHTGMLGVYAAIAPENLRKTIDLSFEELEKLRDEPIGATELNSNAEQLKGGLLIALEGTFNRMARMARSLIYFGRVLTVEEITGAIDAISAQDIQTLAQEIFTRDRCAMAILGPSNGPPVVLPF